MPLRLRDFGVTTDINQGAPWSAALLLAIVLLAIAGVVQARAWKTSQFAAFLVLTAVFSVGGYVFGRCGAIDFYFMRYELLSIIGVAGFAGWFLQRQRPGAVRTTWLTLATAWFVFTATPHVQLYAEYRRRPPDDVRRTLISELDARGIRYASSDLLDLRTRSRS